MPRPTNSHDLPQSSHEDSPHPPREPQTATELIADALDYLNGGANLFPVEWAEDTRDRLQDADGAVALDLDIWLRNSEPRLPDELIARAVDALRKVAPFSPSQVVLNTIPPLSATMGKVEAEVAAAVLVRACQVSGDRWQPIALATVGKVVGADLDARVEPFTSMNRNPFCRPDFSELIKRGFARRTSFDDASPIEFTDEGIEAMRKWVRS